MMVGKRVLSQIDGITAASQLREQYPASSNGWCLDTLAGRCVEISGSAEAATLTTTAALILEAQQRGEPSAWVAGCTSAFFPPDFAASGIDLHALPVVHVPDIKQASRVTDALLRSGGFSLVILDLGPNAELPIPIQIRFAGLAKKHHTAMLCLTRKGQWTPSLGSLVSLRGHSTKIRTSFDRFTSFIHVGKDKRQGPGWEHSEVYHGPNGLC
jgi:recombination protein RecA